MNNLWHSRARLCRIAPDSRGRLSHRLRSHTCTPAENLNFHADQRLPLRLQRLRPASSSSGRCLPSWRSVSGPRGGRRLRSATTSAAAIGCRGTPSGFRSLPPASVPSGSWAKWATHTSSECRCSILVHPAEAHLGVERVWTCFFHKGFQHSLGDAFVQDCIVQQFLQPHIKSPFHRLLFSRKSVSRKRLLPKELESVNLKIQSKYGHGIALMVDKAPVTLLFPRVANVNARRIGQVADPDEIFTKRGRLPNAA
jgi:hypothetical protein